MKNKKILKSIHQSDIDFYQILMHLKGEKVNTNSNFSIYRSKPPNSDTHVKAYHRMIKLIWNWILTIKYLKQKYGRTNGKVRERKKISEKVRERKR